MRNCIALLLIVISSFSVASEQCRVKSQFAEFAMTERQKGVTLFEFFDFLDDNLSDPKTIEYAKAVAVKAWDYRQYFSIEQRVIDDFSNKIAVQCMKG